MKTGAVITADIVNSTRLPKADAKKLMKNLGSILTPYEHEFFRGDSFQVCLPLPEEALSILLQMRTAARKLTSGTSRPLADIRASIGIGQIKFPVKSLQTASDEAFILSGRSFDKLEPNQRLTIGCNEKNPTVNLGLEIMANFVDYLFQHLTAKQASVVSELLINRTQIETARRLKKSQATIHKHIQSAGWPEIEKLLKKYQLLVAFIKF